MKEPRNGGYLSSFGWLNVTQFLGALNDNIFKLFLIYFLIVTHGKQEAGTAVATGHTVFVIPFLLFSALAGVMADRVSKRNVIVWTKIAEVAVMTLAVISFMLNAELGLYAALFLMSTQSAFFGPSKYGIMPELVEREELSRSNALLQAFTFLAVILGTVLAPFLSRATGENYTVATLVCLAIAIVGTLTSMRIERTPAVGSNQKASLFFVRDIWRTLWSIRKDRYLLLAVIASAYFLLIGAFFQLNMIPYAIEELGLSKETGSYLFLFAAIGIGLGSLLAGRWSGRNVELGVVPIGALGLTISAVALGFHKPHTAYVAGALFLVGVSSGLFIVPINAWIQFRCPREKLGEVLGASGWLSWVGALLAAGMVYLFSKLLGLSARTGFLICGVMTLILTIITLKILPDFLVRFLSVLVARIVYRLRIIGAENIPIEGPALLVCNHVSWMDAILLSATQQRRIRFLALRQIYEKPALHWLMKLMGVIPISPTDRPKQLIAAFRAARTAMDEGYLVCIFGEGAITRTGNLLAFRSGFERIVKDTTYPIIPVYLGGAWGSIFSYYNGKPLSHLPLSFPYPVTILFGKPMPANSHAGDIRQAVMELSCEYFNDRKPLRRPLAEEFVKVARENWSRQAIADTTGKKLSFGYTLTSAVALAELLRTRLYDQEKIGLLLPPSVGAVIANLAVGILGKIPVNLNYTASEAAFESAIRQCGIKTVLTSRIFLAKLKTLPAPEGSAYLEDLMKEIDDKAKKRAWLKARFIPEKRLVASDNFNADHIATIIFSSGSTGEPKGVMLSHHNIESNIEALRMIFNPSPEDVVCGVLPFFHSFGFTASLWFPLLSGFSAVYHANPLDGVKVAEVVREYKATTLYATPTFLTLYIRKAKPEDFASLRYVVVGAEKLKTRLADAFEKKFGIRPLEGYGATELAPVATLNIKDADIGGVHQVGAKEGSVGHPLPGIAIKIVDPDTLKSVPPGTEGLMLIKGPNVMLGYLNHPEKTKEILKDGWYNTGDIAVMDQDGFVRITDRLSRFSKIAGEMIPHIAIEDALHQALEKTEQVLAVTSVPDEKKGEKLVVLYTEAAGTPEQLQEIMEKSDLPNLWKPARDAYLKIDALPLLGSGKLDLKKLKSIAQEQLES